MKRIFAALAAVMVGVGILAGCSSASGDGAGTQLKEGATLQDVVNAVIDEVGIAMSAELDDQMVTDYLGMDLTAIEEYYGQIAMVNVSADNIIAMKAAEGRVSEVVEGLENRKQAVMDEAANS